MRTPAAEIVSENGCFATDFKYRSHEIYKGKKPLSGLPAAYVESEDEADTLEILLYDDVIKCGIELSYTVFRDYAAITRSARIVNEGDGSVKLNRAMSLNLDLPDCNFDMVTLCGAWARERNISIRKLGYGAHLYRACAVRAVTISIRLWRLKDRIPTSSRARSTASA